MAGVIKVVIKALMLQMAALSGGGEGGTSLRYSSSMTKCVYGGFVEIKHKIVFPRPFPLYVPRMVSDSVSDVRHSFCSPVDELIKGQYVGVLFPQNMRPFHHHHPGIHSC